MGILVKQGNILRTNKSAADNNYAEFSNLTHTAYLA
jgi:hypothetical protein